MKVVVSVVGRFHSFDLARELHRRGSLGAIYTAYPWFKVARDGLPRPLVRTFPLLHAPYMALARQGWLGPRLRRGWENAVRVSLDARVAAEMPACDVFVGLSGSAVRSGRMARRLGARHVCDRGSSHIRAQEELLREEHERWGQRFDGIDPRVVEAEETEYAEADAITVPSSFVLRTFIERGVSPERLHRLPYGVDLERFQPVAEPAAGGFDLLFVGGMSLRKGVPYLLQAYARLQHPRKTLTFAGAVSPPLIAAMRRRRLWPEQARVLGHVPQGELKQLMSRSHALVLPSVEEGLALVMAQSLACGGVVVATRNTGAEDLFEDGVQGFVVPPRDADALAAALQRLADDPALHARMRAAAIERVRGLGGWHAYGERAAALYGRLLAGAAA